MGLLSTKLPWHLAQTKWASELNRLLALASLQGNQINVGPVIANTPIVINHLLQRVPQGWYLVDNQSNAIVWRVASFNAVTITLEASVNTNISIYVY